MLVDEADAARGTACRETCDRPTGSFILTIRQADLSYTSDDDLYFQGYYDYEAHARVYAGGADPLGSQGYARITKNPSSSWTRPAKQNARGHFYL